MILTLSEARLYCQKALCAAGAAAGIDEEAGHAACWLEARGLPGFAALAEAMARWTGNPEASLVPPPLRSEQGSTVEAEERSAVYLGRALIDLAVVTAVASDRPQALTVRHLHHPQFLLPHVADCQEQGYCFDLAWAYGDAASHCRATAGPYGALALHGDGWIEDAVGKTVTVSLRCYPQRSATPPNGDDLPLWHTTTDLTARFKASLSAGLPVDDGLWDCIAGMAARTYVPASTESRLRGAGSSASDNE